MRHRGRSDYGIQICAENQEGMKGCSGREKRIKMRKTWERLLNKEFRTKKSMFLLIHPKRQGITAFSSSGRKHR